MNYAKINNYDIANGLGVRVSLFVSGCEFHCKGCFNEIAWDFDYGKPFTTDVENSILKMMGNSYIKGFSLLGGEPFHPRNTEVLAKFLLRMKKEFPNKDVWCYTGYELCSLLSFMRTSTIIFRDAPTREMIQCIDYLVVGPFIEGKKDISLKFRGSSNQRIIDVKRTMHDRMEHILDI